MANQSLIADLLKTPSQIRKEREERLLTEGLAQAQLFNQGNRLGGVGGMFASFGAQQAANVGRGMDQAVTALRDAASSATGQDFRRGEERVAGEAQSIMRGVDTNNPQSMLAAADRLATINPRASEALRQRAQALQAAQAKSSSEARQQQFENQLQLRDRILEERRVAVSENKSKAEIDDITRRLEMAEQKLPLELRSMEASTAATVAGQARADEEFAWKRDQSVIDNQIAMTRLGLSQQEADLAARRFEMQGEEIALQRETLAQRKAEFSAELEASAAGRSYKQLTQDAELYSKFTPESVQARRSNPNAPLVPIKDEKEKTAMSAFGKQLVDEGLVYGSDEFNARMTAYNQAKKDAIGKQEVIQGMTQIEQIKTVRDIVESNPTYKDTKKRQFKIDTAKENLSDPNFRSNSELIRVTERTVSEIYNSDSRAASEINRFLEGKGFARGFADWAAATIGGSVSQETQNNLIEVTNIAQRFANKQINDIVSDVEQAYSGVEGLSAENISQALSTYKSKPATRTVTTASGVTYEIVEE